ncbi:transcription initiation factor TFIID subunit 10 [Gracilaria domingensis]|nr:transcription initiation factor TFIID subunit 10 [Gracilaria domingensis]
MESINSPQERYELEKFVASLDEYVPTLPDNLVSHFLNRAGFQSEDIRVRRLVALATQKFIADVANESIARSRMRLAAMPAPKKGREHMKLVLTMEDLESALREFGVNVKKPPYFADSTTAGSEHVIVPKTNQAQPNVPKPKT